jgi:UDP:flavonoid glycosyltransferase YjiC (YdhE family)
MSRFLFASTPVAAHSATPGPIVRRLVERGHEVVWFAGRAHHDRVRSTGARFEPFVDALDMSTGDPYDWFPHVRALRGLRAVKASFLDIFLAQVEPTVADLERILDGFPADAVVSDILVGRATNIVHDRGGPPPAILGDTALSPPEPDYPPWGRGLHPWPRPLNRARNRALGAVQRRLFREVDHEYLSIRARLGVPPDPRFVFDTGASRYLHLQGTVPEFEYPNPARAPHVHFVGPFRPDPPPSWIAPDWWGDLDGSRPVVHLTQGTIRAGAHELLRPAIEGLAGEDILVVATTGLVRVDELGPLPANVRTAPFVPYEALLARADVFLTNGGYVGTNLALRHGVPVVVVGATEDKAEIGARVAYTGVGVALPTTSPRPRAVRDAVGLVLGDSGYRDAARRVRESMARCDATAASVELLERLATEQRPVGRPDPRVPVAAE